MKICFIAPANNYHIEKWASWFIAHGHEIHIISFTNGSIQGAQIHYINTGIAAESVDYIKKIKYLTYASRIKRIIKEIDPDIINAHYATSYGAVMALSGVSNYILSVWGYEIYNFPQNSLIHKAFLKYSLNKAPHLFSTSRAMANETHKYTNKKIDITPFGVDMELFNPNKRKRFGEELSHDKFVIGTVKALSPKYGIEYLIKAVGILNKTKPDIPITLRIAGKGEYEKEYRKLADGCGVCVDWLGFISQEEVAIEWANFDLGIIYSTLDSESFGVSAVEAQACETPLIISDVPGLMEATIPGKTSVVVKRMNENELAKAIAKLYYDPEMRLRMGKNGRQYVERNFELNNCFVKISNLMEQYKANK